MIIIESHVALVFYGLLVGGGHVRHQVPLGLELFATVETVMDATRPLVHLQAILGVESLSTVEALELETLAALLLVFLECVLVNSYITICTFSSGLLLKVLPQSKQSWKISCRVLFLT